MNSNYYWRIDEVNGASTWKGIVRTFTTEFNAHLTPYEITASACSDTDADYPASLVTDKSGLDNTLLLHSTEPNDMWLADSTGSSSAAAGTESGPAWVKFEFDHVCDLEEMYVWNGNDGANKTRGMRNVSVEYSPDGSTWTKLGAYEFTQASGSDDDSGFTACDFNGAEAKYVVITANSTNGNWGDANYYSLSEVRFFGSQSSRVKEVQWLEPWTMQYDATNQKPSDSGALIFSDGTTDTGTAGGYQQYATAGATTLAIDTIDKNKECSYDIATDAGNMDLNSTDGYTVEWRIKLIDSDTTTANNSATFVCSPDVNERWTVTVVKHDGKVWADQENRADGNETEIDADANNPDFHTFRVTVADSNATLYVDGVYVSKSTIRSSSGAPLRFGDTTGTSDANFVIDYVYAYDGGAIGPKEFREPAKNRTRRIIYDNDGCEMVYNIYNPTVQEFIDNRSTALLGKQMDTYVYCTFSSGFGQFTHNTSIGDTFTTTNSVFSMNKTQDYFDQGTDSLEMIVDFCRDNGLEVFWSMRVNDTHDSTTEEILNANQIKQDHPDWLMGDDASDANVVNGKWTAINYAEPNVRELAFQFVEEVCQNYDIDGVMLDFWRHPVLFETHAEGNDCNAAERQLMTDLMTDIREMADEEGMKRGKPILIAARTPDSNTFCENIGLDIETWMANGLIDIWVPTGYFRANTPEYSVDLGHQYDIPVYPSLDEPRMSDPEANASRGTEDACRSRAQNWLYSDANGIYSFNYFAKNKYSNMSRLNEIGIMSTLASLDKTYTTSTRGYAGIVTIWNNSGAKDYFGYDFVAPENTMDINDSAIESIDILIGEDCPATDPNMMLRLRFADELDSVNDVIVDFNDTTVTGYKRIDLNSTTGYTVEWKVKLDEADANDGSYAMIYASPQVNTWWALMVLQHDDKVWAKFNGGEGEVELDSDADNPDYHTLRVTVYDGNATLYVDGNSTSALTDALNTQAVLPLLFGDLTGAADANYFVDYVYACDEGAYPSPDPKWTMRYEADNNLPSDTDALQFSDGSKDTATATYPENSSVDSDYLYIDTMDTNSYSYYDIATDEFSG